MCNNDQLVNDLRYINLIGIMLKGLAIRMRQWLMIKFWHALNVDVSGRDDWNYYKSLPSLEK